MTRAPASRARSAVRSVLPLSTTITSAGMPVARHSRTTPAIGSSSFSVGITTETNIVSQASRIAAVIGKQQSRASLLARQIQKPRKPATRLNSSDFASRRHALLQNEPGACEINRQRNEVGQRERDRARGNFGIEVEAMQKRR